MQLQHLQWRQIERQCLHYLQKPNTKQTLLQLHAFILQNSIETNLNIISKFITSCAPLALVSHARKLFDRIPHGNDTFLCNSMIKSHLSNRQFVESFTLYKDLKRETCFVPDSFTFTTLAKCCGLRMDVLEGLEIHCEVLKKGFVLDLFVTTAFVDMYGKFGDLVSSRKIFDEMPERSLVSWTALIGAYVRCGDMMNARKVFDRMVEKDCVVYNFIIDGYVKVGDLVSARSLFDRIPERNVVSWTCMVYGYCYNGDVVSARGLFDLMPKKNLVSWNAMIGGYCQNKQPHEALKLFQEMQSSTLLEPDEVTIVSILPAIADVGALELGSWVHQYVKRKQLDRASNVFTALVDMYAKCGEISKARQVFDTMHSKGTIAWNALINGLAVNGLSNEALEAFFDMQHGGVKPNDVTMIAILSACNHGGLVDEGKRWFKAMSDYGLTPKLEHYGCLIDLLGKAGFLEEAENVIETMPYKANAIIMSSFLFACVYSKDIKRAERVLDQAITLEPWNDGNYILLRNMYAMEKKWKNVEEIKRLMRRNGARKEAGSSAIEIDRRVSEFISGGTAHPEWKVIETVLEQLWIHTRDKLDLLKLGIIPVESCAS